MLPGFIVPLSDIDFLGAAIAWGNKDIYINLFIFPECE